MTKLIVKSAQWAKDNGHDYMSSVVKSVYGTTYYHIVRCEDVINAGAWIPAPKVQFSSGARGRLGQSKLPEKTISRQEALFKMQN